MVHPPISQHVLEQEPVVPVRDNKILPIIELCSQYGCFQSFFEIDLAIKQYEDETGISLGVSRSKAGVYRVYVCKEHIGCDFWLRFGSRKRDGHFVLKSYELLHRGT